MRFLIFIRHGETAWNREKRFQGGRSDIPLNARGILQSELLAGALLREHVRALFSSPLVRARRTAEIIGERIGLNVRILPELVELNYGKYEGEFEADLQEKYGAEFMRWRESHYTLPAPGGDSIESVSDRVSRAFKAMTGVSEDGDVAVVAHQGILMALKALLQGNYSVEAAKSYKQKNNEIDLWDIDERRPVRRLSLFGSFAGRITGDED